MRYLRSAIVLWVGLIFVVAGVVATAAGVAEWRAAATFEREAVDARATVIAKSIEGASRESNTSTRYLATYGFPAVNGANIEQTEEVPVDVWESLEKGSEVAIRYLPSDPSTARSWSRDPAWMAPFVAIVPALFVLIGGVISWPSLKRAGVIRRVASRGVPTHATVVGVAPTGTRINRVHQWQIEYEFRDSAGRSRRGASDLLAPHEAQEVRPGDRGTVLYDPDRPGDSLWLGRPRGA